MLTLESREVGIYVDTLMFQGMSDKAGGVDTKAENTRKVIF